MVRPLLILAVLVMVGLAIFSNVGDVQATVAWGECASVVTTGERGKAFCESLRAANVLCAAVLYASAFAAGLAGAALNFVWPDRR